LGTAIPAAQEARTDPRREGLAGRMGIFDDEAAAEAALIRAAHFNVLPVARERGGKIEIWLAPYQSERAARDDGADEVRALTDAELARGSFLIGRVKRRHARDLGGAGRAAFELSSPLPRF